MKQRSALYWLVLLTAVLAAVYAGAGLFWQDDANPFSFTTLHGKTVEMYGQGLYKYDSAFKAPILRGTDAVTLFICIPVLIFALALYWRGSLRGGLLLASMLGYFVYNSASLAFGAAYNNLLLVYIMSFSISFFAFVLAITSIDLQTLAVKTSPQFPRRGIAIFLFLAGSSLMVWLLDIISALILGSVPPNLGPYTTEATYTIDLGIIMPAAFLAGILVLRRSPLGTLLASILITLNVSIGLVVASQSIMQALDGIILSISEYITYVMPFVTLSLIAAWLTSRLIRNISDSGPSQAAA